MKNFVYSIIGGACISMGGVAFLSVESKLVGALFFVVGLFVICTMGFNLFTGKVCYVFENNGKYALNLIIIWLGNIIGAFIVGEAIRATRISEISEKAAAICQAKLDDSLLSVFILGIFCNILIYVAVDGYKNNPHELGKYLALFFGVSVFIICGFEHCVANMFYISLARMWSMKAFVFILINTLGNAVGGVIFPIAKRLEIGSAK